MRYYILCPTGRTGSRRLQQILNFKNNFFVQPNLHILPRYKPYSHEVIPDSVEFWTSHLVDASEKEIKTYAEVQEILRTAVDECTVHSHSMMPIPDLENWTVIHSVRKSKAEQIMSLSIADNIKSFKPLDKDIKFEPYVLEEQDVLSYFEYILSLENLVKEMFPNCIEIFLEDTYPQIQEKLKITFDAETLSAIDKHFLSNHRYPDLITNYLDVFKWCGEEPV